MDREYTYIMKDLRLAPAFSNHLPSRFFSFDNKSVRESIDLSFTPGNSI